MAPDGKSLITSVGTAQGTVWLHDEKGDHQISSEGYAYFPYINAQGTRLTYLQADQKNLGASGKPTQAPEIKLISVDLHTGVSQQIFSGQDVGDYCIPPDGRQLMYAARDHNDRVHVWTVPLDHSLPPRRLTPEENDDSNIRCFDNGDVGFTRGENGLRVFYHMKSDGSSMQRVFPTPIVDVAAMDADGSAMAALVKASNDKTRVMLYNLHDGTAKQLCDSCSPMWSPDDKKLYISFAQFFKGGSKERGQTYVLPWKPNLAALPPNGTRTEADVAKVAAVVPEARGVNEFAPGISPHVYAFSRRTIQCNLYRIPLPPG
jgi:eukaryotic-like serine/threonine-protein kinase